MTNPLSFKEVIPYLVSPELQEVVFPLKAAFLFFAFAFAVMIIYFLIKSSWVKGAFLQDWIEFFTHKAYLPYDKKEARKKWHRINARLKSVKKSEHMLALTEASQLLSEALEKKGFSGADLEDQIDKAKLNIKDIDSIKEAIRNYSAISQDPDYEVPLEEAKNILKNYEKVLRAIKGL